MWCFHDTEVRGLRPATRYAYAVSLANVTSEVFRFSTAPLNPEAGFVAAVVGDMGVNQSGATIAALRGRAGSYNFSIHVGDVSYAVPRSQRFLP